MLFEHVTDTPNHPDIIGEYAWDFLQSWYRETHEDRALLHVVEALITLGKDLPTTERTRETFIQKLKAAKLSPEEQALIPEVFDKLQKADATQNVQAPHERSLRDIVLNVQQAYYEELINTYNNEEHNFDTRHADILGLIYDLHDTDQDTCAYIERKMNSWPTYVLPVLLQRIRADAKLAKQPNNENIAKEVLTNFHQRLLRAISTGETEEHLHN